MELWTKTTSWAGIKGARIYSALLRVKPKLHVFGHIHGGHGQESAWNVTLVNCAVVNNRRVLTNPPTVVELAL